MSSGIGTSIWKDQEVMTLISAGIGYVQHSAYFNFSMVGVIRSRNQRSEFGPAALMVKASEYSTLRSLMIFSA